MGIYVSEVAWWNVRPLTFLIWGGVFERLPKLKVAITEGTTVWVPEYLTLMDLRFSETHYSQKLGDYRSHLSLKPSEYFARNVRLGASCMPRREALLRHQIGVGQIMWGTDYPHPEGSWPVTRDQMRQTFTGLPDAEIAAMLGGNASRVLRLRRREARADRRAGSGRARAISRPRIPPPRRPSMTRLRYVKTLEQVKKARENDQEFLSSSMRQIRAEYETDEKIYRALIPKPLEPTARPTVCVTFTDIAMHVLARATITIGAAIFGVKALYDGVEGVNLITMPMTTEQSVVPGRETYGEAKKIAQIELHKDGDRVRASVSRMGFTYLSPRVRSARRSGRASSPSTATASRCSRRASSRSTSTSIRC
jgi:hypothetical protein